MTLPLMLFYCLPVYPSEVRSAAATDITLNVPWVFYCLPVYPSEARIAAKTDTALSYFEATASSE